MSFAQQTNQFQSVIKNTQKKFKKIKKKIKNGVSDDEKHGA